VIRPGVKVQLVIFVVLTLLGVSYVGARYAGLADPIVRPGYEVSADFAESGGVFENAEVTYRGHKVGKVDGLRLTKGGILVDLRIDRGVNLPTDVTATVANRSAVGEQYVDLRPQRSGGPYLEPGDVIPRDRTETPLRVETLLVNLDELVNSVDRRELAVVIDELGKAFAGTAPSLQRFLDSGDALTDAATEALPETIRLIEDGQTVLRTQAEQANHIKSFAKDLADLTDTLRTSDPDFRRLLEVGPPAGRELRDLITRLEPTIPILFSNLITVGQVSSARVDHLRGIFVAYPVVLTGAFTVTPGDDYAHFSLQLQSNPGPCHDGYGGTKRRDPSQTADTPANSNARCKEPKGSPTTVRGAQHAPRPSGGSGRVTWGEAPSSESAEAADESVHIAGYDPATGRVSGPDGVMFTIGSQGGQQALLGKDSWKWLLLGPVGR
jgi:phospholipid/cholesterol/gamma-HCH transport system substrate-binding protein